MTVKPVAHHLLHDDPGTRVPDGVFYGERSRIILIERHQRLENGQGQKEGDNIAFDVKRLNADFYIPPKDAERRLGHLLDDPADSLRITFKILPRHLEITHAQKS